MRREGLAVTRLMMVLSSMSPLFLLWAIRGCPLFSTVTFTSLCLLAVLVPNFFLYHRIQIAKQRNDLRIIKVTEADDHREHLLVYLFAMLLPFYPAELGEWRDFFATLGAFMFIVFLFWHLNMHYMNLLFALFNYRVFTISPAQTDSQHEMDDAIVLLTKRKKLSPGMTLGAYRLSATVCFEEEPNG